MHGQNWDDFRYILALSRKGSISTAAKYLGVNESTVSRRIKGAEERLNVGLFDQTLTGYELTEAGKGLIRRLEKAELHIEAAEQYLETGNTKIAGTVRMTSVPMIVERMLIPNLKTLIGSYPDLEVEMIAEPSDLRLLQRDADIALRLARPRTEAVAIAQKIAALPYGVYVAKTAIMKIGEAELPWIGYEKEMLSLPQAKWIDEFSQRTGEKLSRIFVNDAQSLVQSIKAGHGKSLLPIFVGDQEEELKQLHNYEELPEREVWLLTHPERRHLEPIKVAVKWIKNCINSALLTD